MDFLQVYDMNKKVACNNINTVKYHPCTQLLLFIISSLFLTTSLPHVSVAS
jgi:hypothetical protein